jgi:NACalpha-BTF3-like transcription factor
MEYIKSLNVYVDWENGKIYRKKEKNFLDSLMSIFGKTEGEEFEDITSKDAEFKVKKYKLLELYAIAKKLGKTEFKEILNGKEVDIKIEPERVVVETPQVYMEYRADKFILKSKQTGEVQEKEPTLQEFYTMYKEIRKLLGAGSVQNYLQLKAREPEFKQNFQQMQQEGQMPFGGGFAQPQPQGGGFSWGSALLGLGGGMLLGYLLGSAMGSAFAHEVEHAPPLSEEEQKQIEEQVSAPAEEITGQPVEEIVKEEIVEEIPAEGGDIPEPSLSDVEGDISGDYFADIPDNPFDGGVDDQIAMDDFGGGDDFGGDFDDFGGDFDV